jgi:hypothetical protein
MSCAVNDVVDGLPYRGSFERAELCRALASNGEEGK